jgi:hypothetical protein
MLNKTTKFESFAFHLNRQAPVSIDWTTYRAAGTSKAVPYIKMIGSKASHKDDSGNTPISRPNDQYGSDGNLIVLLEGNWHFMSIKPRDSRMLLQLLLLASSVPTTSSQPGMDKGEEDAKSLTKPAPMDQLLDMLKTELVEVANTFGVQDYTVMQRVERRLKRMIAVTVKAAATTTTTQRFIGLTSATLKIRLKRSYRPEGTLPTPWLADTLDKQ